MITFKDGKVFYNDQHVKPGFSFKPDLFQARIDGIKTETRRLHKKPRFKKEQLVYVREGLEKIGVEVAAYSFDKAGVFYDDNSYGKMILPWSWPNRSKLPAMSMPGEAARFIDRIIEVNEERLKDVTEAGIFAEGIKRHVKSSARPGSSIETTNYYEYGLDSWPDNQWQLTAEGAFRSAWDSINPKHPFDSNPKVVVYKWRKVI